MTLEKFKLLCWKNFTLQKRHPIAGLLEILFPIIIVLLFSVARSNVKTDPQQGINFNAFSPKEYNKCISPTQESIHKVGVSPSDNKALVDLITATVGKGLEVEFFQNSTELDDFLSNANQTVAGIEFDDVYSNSTELPKKLKYFIRLPHDPSINTWLTDQLYPVVFSKKAREPYGPYQHTPPYYESCFLTIQNDIDRGFIKALTNTSLPETILKRFPYPQVSEDVFISFAGPLFPFLLMCCMFLTTKNIIKNVTVERESQLKETMKMMGLSSSLHWWAWFTKYMIMMEISIIVMTILMCTDIVSPMFHYSNSIIIWIFFNIYAVAVITFCFLISVIFKKSTTAANVGSILFFLTLIPFNQLQDKFYSLSYILKVLYCLSLNSGMGQGIKMLLLSEGNEVGIHFTNLFSREPDMQFSVGEVMTTMIFAIAIQIMITIYIEKVFPGDIGIPEPWYFPALPTVRFIRRQIGYKTLVNHDAMLQERRISGADFEEEPTNLKVGVRISNLSKTFGSKSAVSKLNLNIFEDQITVLLGHNGAGKTTTMSMLTGMFPPSSGTAYLNGKDIRTEIDEARSSLGLCPQHNVLFDELTVKEHIIFFARLKGIKEKRAISDEVKRYVSLLELKDKVNAQSKTLSGGMKRKLSIGIALCGDSKIVICDEPSSGMDPAGRRALWDLLIAEKKGRTILISTHHMDEADVLADRIAIMADGKLRTVGSSFYLKKKFGTGYKLTCVKDIACDANSILDALKEYAPDSQIESDAQTEAIFIISEVHLPKFETIFKRLEDDSAKLRITSFGCNLSTLEEVFLKLGTDPSTTDEEEQHEAASSESVAISFNDLMSSHKVTGTTLVLYQAQAMILKKFHFFRRNYRSFLYMALFSIWIIVMLMSTPTLNFSSIPSRDISFNPYEDTTTIIEMKDQENSFVKSYLNLFSGKDNAVLSTENMENFFIRKANESLSTVNQKYLIGATINYRKQIVAWFNGQPYHTVPLTLNTINRALIKTLVGHEHDIEVVNKPYVWSDVPDSNRRDRDNILSLVMPMFIFFILLIHWPSIFIGFYIKERESRAKLLQLISGANRFIYWLVSFLFDFTILSIVICAIVFGIGAYQRTHLSTAGELSTLILLFLFYAFSTLPLIYAFSYLFSKHSTGESMVAVGGLLLAVLYGVHAILKYLLEAEIWKVLGSILYWIGLMIGPFSLLDSLTVIVMSPDAIKFTLDENGIGRNMLMMFIGGVLFITICLMKDHMLFEWFIYRYLKFSKKPSTTSQEMDADVKREVDRIKNMSEADVASGNLVLKGLNKYYGNHLAVNQLYLAVGGAECFGLLGINGAGKTTTFKMMTGDEMISSGDASIQGYSMKNQMHKVHKLIGYCPQFDALLMDLTGRETIEIFSLLRGIPRNEILEVTNKLSLELGFHKHLDKKIDAFSGGNKRKLSTALALIGDPSLIFLDEPTTGMDPGAKRQLWNIVNKVRNSGRSVIMTSHSMEECEALCTKLAIMVNGEFKCLGSTQHLKNKFSKGFILTIKAGRDDDEITEEIKNRVQQMFPSADMKEKYLDILTFHITDNLKWSEMFAMLAQMKNELSLADYALSQTTLEQVFLFFTKSGLYQRDAPPN